MRTVLPKKAILIPERAECVFKGEIFDVYQWQETMFDGSLGTFEMLRRADSVEVMVIDGDRILIQKQVQPFKGAFLSLPGGRHDHPDEDELAAVKRELKEESGLVCREWRLVQVLQRVSFIESFQYAFVASGVVEQVPQQLDPGEKIENVWMTIEETKAAIAQEGFRSSSTHFIEGVTHAGELFDLPAFQN